MARKGESARARRRRERRGRIGFVLLFVAIGVGAVLVLRAHDRTAVSTLASPSGPGPQAVVALPDGETLVAPEGTPGRDIFDWIASGQAGSRAFELGGHQFTGDTAEPTAESFARIDRFVAMLKTNPDVSARIIGYSDARPDAASAAEARARRVADEIAARGIERDRLSVAARGAADPIADNATEAGRARNRRVVIVVTRAAALAR